MSELTVPECVEKVVLHARIATNRLTERIVEAEDEIDKRVSELVTLRVLLGELKDGDERTQFCECCACQSCAAIREAMGDA